MVGVVVLGLDVVFDEVLAFDASISPKTVPPCTEQGLI